ncbi:hypothetical protein KIN20_036815 [Parelaphostrongylus tenuis]|uniref:Uncharacterized protein n=1 Tax=Parelaphostrongylus tenuis TaxID=148309 RepID=A0AAD5RGY5_PARTN|nr:hypothetical protein KIN20_036815 [Parelaphostrongylus tenuis]
MSFSKIDTVFDVLSNVDGNLKENCIIAGGNTVTGICRINNAMMMCEPDKMTIAAIPPQHLSISGTISTTNIIVANWSRQMWQNVVNRAVRMLASGFVWIALLRGSCHSQLKLKLDCDVSETNISI